MFKCDKCGECCRNLQMSEVYKKLHNGDGVCVYLNGNLCSIYEDRPLICRVDEYYNIFLKDKISYEEYIDMNYYFCNQLKNKRRK